MNRRIVMGRGALALLASLALLAAPLGAQQKGAKAQEPKRQPGKGLEEKVLETQEYLGKLQEALTVEGQALHEKFLESQLLFDGKLLKGELLQGQFFGEQLFEERLLHEQALGQQLFEHPLEKFEGQLAFGPLLEDKLVQGQLADERFMGTLHENLTAHGQLADKLLSNESFFGPGEPSWFKGDPADSAYRAAYQLFSRQEYRAAAERFGELRTKYPTTRYLCDASYFEAFARYRLGTPAELRTARKVLDGMDAGCANASRLKDVPELQARIDGALARLGDAGASERLRKAASEGRGVCDREERNVKIQALSALAQMDGDGARPILDKVLAQKDECSAPVRREALQLVARNNDATVVPVLLRSAKNDPDPETRGAAVEALGRINAEPAYAAMEDLLRTTNDENVQVAAVRAMSRSENPKAQASIRALAERQDVSERLRMSVISSMGSRGDTPVTYWRTLYNKVESDELRRAVVNAVDRESPDGAKFLLEIAGDAKQPSTVRALAVSRVRQNAPIADLYKLFETADSRTMRQAIVSGLAARKEPEATDRLIDIAKRGTDPEVRAAAIRYLGQPARRDDPKVRKALADILGAQS